MEYWVKENQMPFRASRWLFFTLLILLEVIIYRDFIFGDSLFLFKDLGDDSLVSMYPAWQQRIDVFSKGIIPGWSFQTAMGENIYPYSFEPVALLILLFFKNNVAFGFIWVQLSHTFLSGCIFYYFLRNLKVHEIAAIFGGLLYAFSGYMLVAGSWMTTIFATECTQLAFVLFSLQQFLSKKRKYLYPLAVAYASLVTPFNLYFVAIISVVYFLVKWYIDNKVTIGLFIKELFSLLLSGCIGIGLSCFILLSNLAVILNSPRGNFNYSFNENARFFDFKEFKTVVLRIFSSNTLGNPDDFMGWKNYFESPILNSSLLLLFLIPLLFNYISSKTKIACSLILCLVLALLTVPLLRHSFWLFSGDYFRSLSLFYITLSLLLGSITLHYLFTKGAIYNSKKILFYTVAPLIALLSFSYNQTLAISPSITVIIFFILLYSAILFFGSKFLKYPFLILGLVCIELIVFSAPALTERKNCLTTDFVDNSNTTFRTKKALDYIKQIDTSFYRIEKDYFSLVTRDRSYNDAKVENYFGTKSYNSFHNKNYIAFLENIDVLNIENEYSTRWLNGLAFSPEAMRLCNVKYFISYNNDTTNKVLKHLKFINKIDGLYIYENPNPIPFGTAFSKTISEEDFLAIEKNKRINILIDGIPLKKKDVLKSNIQDTFTKSMTITSFSPNKIVATIDVKDKMFLFLSLPFDKGWTLKDNNKAHPLIMAYFGLSGTYLEAGKHQIELEFKDRYKKMGTIISLVSLFIYLLFLSLHLFKVKNKFLISDFND